MDITLQEAKIKIAANVAAGAAYLDQHLPNWRDLIDWEEFDFNSNPKCIYGQINNFLHIGFYLRQHLGFCLLTEYIPNGVIESAIFQAEWIKYK